MRWVIIAILLFFPAFAFSHEQWFLTSHQMHDLMAAPRPKLFSELNQTNISIFITVFFTMFTLIIFWRKAANEFFPDHQKRLASLSRFVPLFIRITTAGMLFMSVFGLNPRSGAELFSAPTFIFPDLQLSLLTSDWGWLRWAECVIAIGLLLGIYVRLMAIILLSLSILSLFLFKIGMLCYFGFIVAITLYLILQGGRCWYIPLSIPRKVQRITHWLDSQPVERAQAFLLLFAGLDFALTGFICKFIYPNLAIGLLIQQHMPTFGLDIETVVLWMAIIETFAGVFLMFGILVRPVAFILMGCFIFMAYAINEALYSHLIFFGVLIAFYINGSGRWRIPVAKDKPANIVIIGASLAGIYSAMKLENLLGKISNVHVTIIHHENYFQFGPLVSSIISGIVQPANIMNLIRQVCPTLQFIQGSVKKINPHKQQLEIELLSKQECILNYDQLIIAHEKLNRLPIAGLYENTIPVNNINDALYIRKHILECLEQAELMDQKNRAALLSFVIIGEGLRSISVATEVHTLIKSAIEFYPTLSLDEIRISILAEQQDLIPTFQQQVSRKMQNKLTKMGIHILTKVKIASIQNKNIMLTANEGINSHTIINATSNYTELMPVDRECRVKDYKNIFSVSISAFVSNKIPFQALLETKLGKFVAYNAWANSQGLPLKTLKQNQNILSVVCLNRYSSIIKIGNVVLTGASAWIISRLICVMMMPGLEKNLRLIMDWIFNIPFKSNTCTFSTTLTQQTDETFKIEEI